jgi:hypothetical protein
MKLYISVRPECFLKSNEKNVSKDDKNIRLMHPSIHFTSLTLRKTLGTSGSFLGNEIYRFL